ncbi:MAG: DeoR/GlpR family DNA-binding transcription regulator [Lachnospiraceae bacterium]|nr:DeoR/GlpR family DNA-binding transcription regulator [Lachnospiraceae bacterium]
MRENRKKQIIFELEQKSYITVSDIAQKLNCSIMTIRRDFDALEKEGIIKRLPGGAVLAFPTKRPFANFRKEIDAVGKIASKLVEPGSVICIDAGTSSRAVAAHLPADFPVTIITTSLCCSFEVKPNPNMHIIQVGGTINFDTYSTFNDLSLDTYGYLSSDIAFISTFAFNLPGGAHEKSLTLLPPKQYLASLAKKVVLLLDHTKIGLNALCISMPLEKIDTIITDSNTSATQIESLRNTGKEILIADMNAEEI